MSGSRDCTWVATLPDAVTAYVAPDRTTKLGTKVARGSRWRGGISQWEEATRTIKSFGPNTYEILYDSRQDAQRAVEQAYHIERTKRDEHARRTSKLKNY